jgi:transcriptional regulator with GAF, ATPase, and Fis domain
MNHGSAIANDGFGAPTMNGMAPIYSPLDENDKASADSTGDLRTMSEPRARAERLERRVRLNLDDPDLTPGRGRIIGESPAWRNVLVRATQVAVTEATVFLQGQSGTGKEVVARFVHRASPRRRGPFVAINCAALPENLLESELFGYERGAFTGAHQSKAGHIEMASGGVLFLDEVSEMSPMAQAKFLRFLQEREFQRLGGTRLLKANVRVIAASNRDLREAVEQRTFREDLYYRLQVFDIAIPPLRERASDIPLLAEAFLEEFANSLGGKPAMLTPAAEQQLMSYSWPGNVRQLRNVLERASILSDSGLIASEHLHLPTQAVAPHPTTEISEIERRTIAQVMRETDGNKSRAARRLGLTRTQLYVRLRRYGLTPAMAEDAS